MGIKEVYNEIKEDAIFTNNKYSLLIEGENTFPATIDSIPYEEGRLDVLAEILILIEQECPEVLVNN